MASMITGDEASLFGKLTKGVYGAATFGGAYIKALSEHRAWEREVDHVAF